MTIPSDEFDRRAALRAPMFALVLGVCLAFWAIVGVEIFAR